MYEARRKRTSRWICLLLLIGVTAYVLFTCILRREKEKGVWIGAVGDIMVHTGQLTDAWDASTETFDFTPAFSEIKTLLTAQNLMVGNLETTCSGPGAVPADVLIHGYTGYPAFNTPDAIATALKESGFDLLGVANNHALDGGEEGWKRTVSVLQEAGLKTAGDTPCTYCTVRGLRIAVLAATAGTNGKVPPEGFPLLQEEENLLQRIRDAKTQADLVVLLLHDGVEYESTPTEALVQRTDACIAAGCDVIFVSHAHVPGPVALRKVQDRQGLVFYGLGNFISAQSDTAGLPEQTAYGLLASVYVAPEGGITQLRLYPTCCTRGAQAYQAQLMREEAGLAWFKETVLQQQQYTYQSAEGCFVIDLQKKEE